MKAVISSSAILALLTMTAACDQIRTPGSDRALEEEPAVIDLTETELVEAEPNIETASVTSKRAVIDWESARTDFATRTVGQDENLFEVASASNIPVPILLPSMPVSAASSDESAMSFRPLEDGYYAVYPGDTYDMIINGTDRLVAAAGREAVPSDTELRFEETMTGAQIAFSRYGASYLVQFACKSPAAALGNGCVTEEDARTAVQDLLLAGTQ
ncbi:MAG: hypothetical protein Hens3KO_09650 [Henriciella sp.]